MKVIAISNQKGGVGKTTTSMNLSHALVEAGQRVLLLDLDPQANSTSALGVVSEPGTSLYRSFIGEQKLEDTIVATGRPGLDLVPSHMDLAGCEVDLAQSDNHLETLRHMLDPLIESRRYDYAVLDTPPSLGILMTAAIGAADEVLVPIQCEYFGLEGLSKIVQVVEMIRGSGANPRVFIEGIVMTMFDTRTRLSQDVVDDVRRVFPETIYDTIIPRTVKISEAPSHAETILEYDPKGRGAIRYRELAAEFLKRHGVPATAAEEEKPAAV